MLKQTCWLLLCVVAFGCAAPEPARRPPNIVYILADDLGYGELGSYGQTLIETPHLDRLAEEGMRFLQHYSGSPVCAPSRCTLLTGKHTGNCQVRDNYELGGFLDSEERGQLPLEPGTFTMGRMLQEMGYATAAVGKWGLGGPGSTGVPNLQGFDFFYGYLDQKQAHNYYPSHLWRNTEWDTLRNGYFHPHQEFEGEDPYDPAEYERYKGLDYAPDLMAQEAEDFIRAHANQPFFLYFPHMAPHLALQVPDEELARYDGVFDEEPDLGAHGYLPHVRPKSAYAGMITRMDAHVGRILDVIDEMGLRKNTLVVFSSDNGPTFLESVDTQLFNSSGPLRGGKGQVYEGGIRVPMIARWPGRIAAGSTSGRVTAFWDVMPTMAELIGYEVSTGLDGVSFLPTLEGEMQSVAPSTMYWEYHSRRWNGAQAARIGNWKAVRLGGHVDGNAPLELYDLTNDPGETRDVAADRPEVVAQMHALMARRSVSPIDRWNFVHPVQ